MQNNIRQLRQAKGWSMEELASRIEGQPHFTTIAKLERSTRNLTTTWMQKIADALHVEPADLIATDPGLRMRRVPMIGSIPAGNWQEAIHDPIAHVIAPAGGPNVFALLPKGDSMNEVIMAGAYVVIDPDNRELLDGRIYAVLNATGDSTLKMYRTSPPRLEPRSSNAEHRPVVFGEEPFTVIGRVIWQGMEL